MINVGAAQTSQAESLFVWGLFYSSVFFFFGYDNNMILYDAAQGSTNTYLEDLALVNCI